MQAKTYFQDTIAARATPAGRGGVGIIRISGTKDAITAIAKNILSVLPKPRYAAHAIFLAANGAMLDDGLAIYFPAPYSFTGEDVLELQGHGGAIVLDVILQRVIELGARLARPGEFSERAFLNGKIDLLQAEAIADLIDASSQQAARCALRSLRGEFSQLITDLVEKLIVLRVQVEAWIDFPEEEIDPKTQKQQALEAEKILSNITEIKKVAKQGVLLREGITVVIVGKPNAGKSSLLNRLTGQDTAIVTPIPGTTRDVLRAPLQIDGLPLHLLDTAGLQETADIVEQEGIRRARKEIGIADHILCLVDAKDCVRRDPKIILQELGVVVPARVGVTIIFNKIDLSGESEKICEQNGIFCIYLSAKTGQGMELLRTHLKDSVGFKSLSESDGIFSARRRHLQALDEAEISVLAAQQHLQVSGALELIAEELRRAQRVLGEITGEFSSEDLLSRIFSEFCIGK